MNSYLPMRFILAISISLLLSQDVFAQQVGKNSPARLAPLGGGMHPDTVNIGAMRVYPDILRFGATGITLVRNEDTAFFTVTNTGSQSDGYVVAFTTGTSAAYQIFSPFVFSGVMPGDSATFSVGFHPDTIGPAYGQLVVSSVSRIKHTVILAGMGGGVAISSDGGGLVSTQLGKCDTFEVSITNNGNVPWTPGTATETGANASDFLPLGTTIPPIIQPGVTGKLRVVFCPTTVGYCYGSIDFQESSPVPLEGAPIQVIGIGTSNAAVGENMTTMEGLWLGASYPNPAARFVTIPFKLPSAADTKFALFDPTGVLERTIALGVLRSGDHVVTLDCNSLLTGTYFYTLTSGGMHLTRELTVQR